MNAFKDLVEPVLLQHFTEAQVRQVFKLCSCAELGVEPCTVLGLLKAGMDWTEYRQAVKEHVARCNKLWYQADRAAKLNR